MYLICGHHYHLLRQVILEAAHSFPFVVMRKEAEGLNCGSVFGHTELSVLVDVHKEAVSSDCTYPDDKRDQRVRLSQQTFRRVRRGCEVSEGLP